MLTSTLYVRNAGFGDMLGQINIFFHLADVYGFNPKIFLPKVNPRNTLRSHVFFDEIGFASIIGPRPRVFRKKAQSLSEIVSKRTDVYKFDPVSYGNQNLAEVLEGREAVSHPRLSALATQSNLYAEIAKRQGADNRVVAHVRRGDVAQIYANDFPELFDKNLVAGKILHCRGVLNAMTLFDELPGSDYWRFVDAGMHLDLLNAIKEREGVDSHILVSDGFTKIAKRLTEQNPWTLVYQNLSADLLETALEEELRPLMVGAHQMLIGENNALFYDTLFTALAAKVIISQSPGFLQKLSALFQLDIEFIFPETPLPK